MNTQQKIFLFLEVIVIILLLFVSGVMFYIGLEIRTNGGQCTANPLGYAQLKFFEKNGFETYCSCSAGSFPGVNPNIDMNFDLSKMNFSK